MNAWFFSLDPEKHWPNYATLVTTDEHDEASEPVAARRLPPQHGRRPGDVRTRRRGEPGPGLHGPRPVLPHPVYAAQRWICIVNPSEATFRDVVVPLLTVAHDRLADQRARHGLDKG